MAELDVLAGCAQLDAELRAAGTPERAEQEKRYLKSDLRHYGATMPAVNRAARAFSNAHPDLTRAELRALVEALWEPGVHELRATAVELMTLRVGYSSPNRTWLGSSHCCARRAPGRWSTRSPPRSSARFDGRRAAAPAADHVPPSAPGFAAGAMA